MTDVWLSAFRHSTICIHLSFTGISRALHEKSTVQCYFVLNEPGPLGNRYSHARSPHVWQLEIHVSEGAASSAPLASSRHLPRSKCPADLLRPDNRVALPLPQLVRGNHAAGRVKPCPYIGRAGWYWPIALWHVGAEAVVRAGAGARPYVGCSSSTFDLGRSDFRLSPHVAPSTWHLALLAPLHKKLTFWC